MVVAKPSFRLGQPHLAAAAVEIEAEAPSVLRDEVEWGGVVLGGGATGGLVRRALTAAGYVCPPHAARQTVRADYEKYDLLIGMDGENLENMRRIYGGDPEGKISLLREWAGEPGMEIDDPWYTRDFDGCLEQIVIACRGIYDTITSSAQTGKTR